jgi:predicted deacylase
VLLVGPAKAGHYRDAEAGHYRDAAAGHYLQGDAHPTFTVGTATAPRGQKAYGVMKVPAGSDAGYDIPVAVVHGAKPGPVLAIVSGAHGTEYASIVAVQQLIDAVAPADLSGTLILVPLVNVPSFEKLTPHVNPTDNKSMNSRYPGDLGGTQTDRASAVITKEVVERCDHLIDLHGGDLDENLRPYSYWTRTGNAAQDEASHSLVLAFGLDHIILRDVDIANAASVRSLGGYSLLKGKTMIVAEAGRSGTVLDADVNALINGCLNILGSLKMIARPVAPVAKPVWVSGGSRVTADKQGMFFATAARDTIVAEGATIGYMTDFVGRRITDIKAPVGGLITFIRGVPSTWNGATLVNISPVLPEPPPYKKPVG